MITDCPTSYTVKWQCSREDLPTQEAVLTVNHKKAMSRFWNSQRRVQRDTCTRVFRALFCVYTRQNPAFL